MEVLQRHSYYPTSHSTMARAINTTNKTFSQAAELMSGGIYLVLHKRNDSKAEPFQWSFYYHVRYIEAGSLFSNSNETTTDGRRYVISRVDSGHWVPRHGAVTGTRTLKSEGILCKILIGVSRNAGAVDHVMTGFDRQLNDDEFQSNRRWAVQIVRRLEDAGILQSRDKSDQLAMLQREVDGFGQACEQGYLTAVHDSAAGRSPIVSSQICF